MIYITHGVVPTWQPERISHALFHPESEFVEHLQSRQQKYVSLAGALAGEGDALTIDDATHGGLRAGLLALKYGHAVSWFVNGSNVQRRHVYFPFQISRMLDDTLRRECRFEGRTWKLENEMDRRCFRQHLKNRYMTMSSPTQINDLVAGLSTNLEVDCATIESALRTVTSRELKSAAAAGIELQNHGWNHLNPLALSESSRETEATLNEDYLSQFRRPEVRVYAPPFGKKVLLRPGMSDFILLADRGLPPNLRIGNSVNRADLRLNEFAVAKHAFQIRASLPSAG